VLKLSIVIFTNKSLEEAWELILSRIFREKGDVDENEAIEENIPTDS
jgi:hypothetical protein